MTPLRSWGISVASVMALWAGGVSALAQELSAEEVFSLSQEEGLLALDVKLSPEEMTFRRVYFTGLPGQSHLRYRSSTYTITNEHDVGGETVQIAVQQHPYQMVVQYLLGTSGHKSNVRLVQFDNRENGTAGTSVTLTAKGEDGRESVFKAPDFQSLKRNHPIESYRHLAPVFRALRAPWVVGVEPGLARQVLAERLPADRIGRNLARLVEALDSDRPAQREAAAAAIESLGPDAIVLLGREDRSKLSAQQQAVVEALVQSPAMLRPEEVRRFAEDPHFLVDCLYCPDAGVRAAALARLAGKVPGKPQVDTQRDPMEQTNAIEALRATLTRPKQ